jgi:hypothetical protein
MSSAAPRKKENPLTATASVDLDELRSNEAAAQTAYEALGAQVSALDRRFNEPLADDTRETLKQVRNKLSDLQADLAIAKREYETAATIRTTAAAEAKSAADRRRRQDLEASLDEAVRTVPPIYRRQAEELLATVTRLHRLDQEIAEYNKTRPAGTDFIPTFEMRVRWTPRSDDHGAIYPAPLAEEFEIPGLQRGDLYRVPGTFPPQGYWRDVHGRLRS